MGHPDVEAYVAAGERRQDRWSAAGRAAGWLGILALAAGSLVVGLNLVPAGEDRVLEAIRASGLRDPRLGGASLLACATAESSRAFTATSSLGQRVAGTVCCGLTGLGKGCTIRWSRPPASGRPPSSTSP